MAGFQAALVFSLPLLPVFIQPCGYVKPRGGLLHAFAAYVWAARRFGIGGWEAAALADALEDGGVLGSNRPPYGQRCNFVRKRKAKK